MGMSFFVAVSSRAPRLPSRKSLDTKLGPLVADAAQLALHGADHAAEFVGDLFAGVSLQLEDNDFL